MRSDLQKPKESSEYGEKMGNWRREILCYVILVSILFADFAESKKKKNSLKKPNRKETSLFNFFRLVLYRLIYGFATMFGGQESISEFMGGIFVPPGADEGDYRDYLDGDDEDDYEY